MMMIMSKPSWTYRMPGRGYPETFRRFRHLVVDLELLSKSHFGGAKITQELVSNAAVDHFCSLPMDEKIRLVAAYIPEAERQLAGSGEEPERPIPARSQSKPKPKGSNDNR